MSERSDEERVQDILNGRAMRAKEIEELEKQVTELRAILLNGGKFIPHFPKDYAVGWGGANNSPCVDDCPKCALDRASFWSNREG